MSLIIHAPNVHTGGGRTLLVALLAAVAAEKNKLTLILDKRFQPLPEFLPETRVILVAPNIYARLKAEYLLKQVSQRDDTILCFGNLPPLFANKAKVFVYLQNRYLSSARSLRELPWRVRLRIRLEREWLYRCLRECRLLVQTETMAQEAKIYLRSPSLVMPFLPAFVAVTGAQPESTKVGDTIPSQRFDYLYVASGEPHKNHRRLINAWALLAKEKCFPSLCLTLDTQQNAPLLAWIERRSAENGLKIINRPLPPEHIACLYSQSDALIYPSLFESFGLPLLEARLAGLTIIAAERDYVRDVVAPVTTFDPESELSIARAVLRHRALGLPPIMPGDASAFLLQLEHEAG